MKVLVEKSIDDSKIEEYFYDDSKCLHLLSSLKWSKGFVCRKCGNNNFCDGKVPYSRRCTRCKNEESATSNTLFHNNKFPINKAFYIAYQVCIHPGTFSAFDIANKLSLRQMTCWNFMHKVENKITRMTNFNPAESLSFQEILISNDESPFI
jgi:predicted Zn-ribbon and HTH transcriptional regulator